MIQFLFERNRRGMDAVSGTYHYEYDDLGRLTKSTLNGNLRAEYKYDAFGNRTEMTEADTKTSYEYDALDRLTRSIVRDSSNNETSNIYSYDRRGNQVAITSGDIIKKTFKYDAMGKMTQATDTEKGDISYTYNGLGFRVESQRPEERIEYLCDISKDYYNLLERTVNGETESFIYDNNVVSMNKCGNNYYYLQDELGSTMYLTGTDGLTVDAYAYDDFGRRVDPYTGKLRNRQGNNDKTHAYTKNGNIIQPFAFTGYQEEERIELSFAQARYYNPNLGRFLSEDLAKGYKQKAETLNRYEYCLNNPIIYVDYNGKNPDNVVKYDREAAVEYAKQWSSTYQGMDSRLEYLLASILGLRNPEYKSHTSNCANFVSQCMAAGGIPLNDDWHCYHTMHEVEFSQGSAYIEAWEETPAWINADKQYRYFSNPDNGYINGDVIKIDSADQISSVANDKNNQVQPGDLLYFDFDGDGKIDHATIVTKVENGEIYYAGNTVRRFDQPLSESYQQGYDIYIVRINDEVPAGEEPSREVDSDGGCLV